MGRPFDQHINDQELDALVPSASEAGRELHGLSSDAVREAKHHVESCSECRRKVAEYRLLLNRLANALILQAARRGPSCPEEKDVEWQEVAAGLWPEWKAMQLMMHAALCDHCGPLLRAATSVMSVPTPQEESLLAELKAPSRPVVKVMRDPISTKRELSFSWRQFLQWRLFVPVAALILIVGVFSAIRPPSPVPLAGQEYAKFAVNTHRQFTQGSLALDLLSDSQQTLNRWLEAKSPFSFALPVSQMGPSEEKPYRLEGARMVRIGSKTAAYIVYQMQTGPVSLMVTSDSVAVASGGVAVDLQRLNFHYRMVEGYKVVTWSVHGLTYAQVSQEGNNTQRSCMVCHSAMKDRDLSQTPTPLSQKSPNTL